MKVLRRCWIAFGIHTPGITRKRIRVGWNPKAGSAADLPGRAVRSRELYHIQLVGDAWQQFGFRNGLD